MWSRNFTFVNSLWRFPSRVLISTLWIAISGVAIVLAATRIHPLAGYLIALLLVGVYLLCAVRWNNKDLDKVIEQRRAEETRGPVTS